MICSDSVHCIFWELGSVTTKEILLKRRDTPRGPRS